MSCSPSISNQRPSKNTKWIVGLLIVGLLLVGLLLVGGAALLAHCGFMNFWGNPLNKIHAVKTSDPNEIQTSSNIEVKEIHFDPIAIGRNKVTVTVRNKTDAYQAIAIYIQTNSPGGGWGGTCIENLEPQQEKEYPSYFSIYKEITDKTRIRLQFFNPPAPSYDAIRLEEYFLEKKYLGSELERRKPDDSQPQPVPPELASAVTSQFQQIRDWLRDEKYDEVWNVCTLAYQQDEFHSMKSMCEENLNKMSRRGLQVQSLTPADVVKKDSVYILNATLDKANWQIHFVSETGQWKLDDIQGYIEPRKENNELASFEKRAARHFDVYYKKGSSAERDIEKIANERDSGFEEICEFLGTNPDVRITLVFFEDGETKRKETGHQGNGMAKGTLIVEVYNQEIQLDPFHETTHILASEIGHPPAIFNEGFATYMSKRLVTPFSEVQEDTSVSLYEKVKESKAEGEWIPLQELLTFTEIGPEWSKPQISYPEAGSFVKFLIDTYGKEKFLQAYKSLENSEEDAVRQQNVKNLEQLYGKSLNALSQEWQKTMGLAI